MAGENKVGSLGDEAHADSTPNCGLAGYEIRVAILLLAELEADGGNLQKSKSTENVRVMGKTSRSKLNQQASALKQRLSKSFELA